MNKLRKCGCGYTMNDFCRKCGRSENSHPQKFSIEDKYGRYRRMAREKL